MENNDGILKFSALKCRSTELDLLGECPPTVVPK